MDTPQQSVLTLIVIGLLCLPEHGRVWIRWPLLIALGVYMESNNLAVAVIAVAALYAGRGILRAIWKSVSSLRKKIVPATKYVCPNCRNHALEQHGDSPAWYECKSCEYSHRKSSLTRCPACHRTLYYDPSENIHECNEFKGGCGWRELQMNGKDERAVLKSFRDQCECGHTRGEHRHLKRGLERAEHVSDLEEGACRVGERSKDDEFASPWSAYDRCPCDYFELLDDEEEPGSSFERRLFLRLDSVERRLRAL